MHDKGPGGVPHWIRGRSSFSEPDNVRRSEASFDFYTFFYSELLVKLVLSVYTCACDINKVESSQSWFTSGDLARQLWSYDTIRYDTIEEFNVDWKAEYSALSSTRSQKKKLKQPTPVPL